MNKILKNLLKSIVFGLLVFFGFFLVLGSIFNGDSAEMGIVGISVIVTLLYCTYTIIDAIKLYGGK